MPDKKKNSITNNSSRPERQGSGELRTFEAATLAVEPLHLVSSPAAEQKSGGKRQTGPSSELIRSLIECIKAI
jgi:hypothetical protein